MEITVEVQNVHLNMYEMSSEKLSKLVELMEANMLPALQTLKDEVEEIKTVGAGMIAYQKGLAEQLATMVQTAKDKEELEAGIIALAQDLDSTSKEFAASMVAGTKAETTEPPVTSLPEPEPTPAVEALSETGASGESGESQT